MTHTNPDFSADPGRPWIVDEAPARYPVVGDTVRLVNVRFLPAEPHGVVTAVQPDKATLTFEEDFGGGTGTYPVQMFHLTEPDELTLKWRADQYALLIRSTERNS